MDNKKPEILLAEVDGVTRSLIPYSVSLSEELGRDCPMVFSTRKVDSFEDKKISLENVDRIESGIIVVNEGCNHTQTKYLLEKKILDMASKKDYVVDYAVLSEPVIVKQGLFSNKKYLSFAEFFSKK